jgi:hypothetical protein
MSIEMSRTTSFGQGLGEAVHVFAVGLNIFGKVDDRQMSLRCSSDDGQVSKVQ